MNKELRYTINKTVAAWGGIAIVCSLLLSLLFAYLQKIEESVAAALVSLGIFIFTTVLISSSILIWGEVPFFKKQMNGARVIALLYLCFLGMTVWTLGFEIFHSLNSV